MLPLGEPATVPPALPPGGRLPARVHSPELSRGGARPSSGPRALHPRLRRAVRRLSTSATEPRSASTTHGSPEPRPPRSRSPAHAALRRTGPFRRRRGTGGWPGPFRAQPTETSRVRGRSPDHRPTHDSSCPRSLAAGASPQPDPLGHLVSRESGRRWPELPPPRHPVGCRPRSRPAQGRFRAPRLVGPPRTPLREEERSPLHPRCLPSPMNPAGLVLPRSTTRGRVMVRDERDASSAFGPPQP